MSTPVDLNIVMPYGYTVGGSKDYSWLTRVDGRSANIDLVPGPCRVVASWAGPEKVTLNLVRGNERIALDTIPEKAGGVAQFSDGHRRRYRGRPGASRSVTPHHDRRDRNHRGVPGGGHRVANRAGAVV